LFLFLRYQNLSPTGLKVANTYSDISIHVVFAVKHRQNLITALWRDELHKYISGMITGEGAKSLAVGGWKDHVHVLFGMPLTASIPDLMKKAKGNSSKWINERGFVKGKFQWQEGYAAFSCSKSHRDRLIKYIQNQEQRHESKSFKEEYLAFLAESNIEYDPKYIFEFY
jgi:putative transposase